MAEEKKSPDWERIEAQYRAGAMSLREIAAEHGITEGAIRKRAKRDEWIRDLAEKVRIKADDLVRKEQVRNSVRIETPTERQVINEVAATEAHVRISQRSDISRSRALCMSLLAELEAQTADVTSLAALGEMMRAEDDRGVDKLNELYRAVIGLPERTKTMKALSDSLKNLVALEREAYGIASASLDDSKPKDTGRPMSAEEAYRKMIGG